MLLILFSAYILWPTIIIKWGRGEFEHIKLFDESFKYFSVLIRSSSNFFQEKYFQFFFLYTTYIYFEISAKCQGFLPLLI